MMTHQEMINVITHHMNGGQVQSQLSHGRGKWEDNTSPQWQFYCNHYRAKPEPMVLWAEIMTDGRHIQSSLNQFKPTNGGAIKKFIEAP